MKTIAIGAAVALALAGCAAGPADDAPAPSAPASAAAAAQLDDSPLDSQLLDAVRAGDVAYAELALDAGANVDAPLGENTPLTLAVTRDDLAMVELLLANGATHTAEDGRSVLNIAATFAGYDVAVALVAGGADPNGAGEFAGTPMLGAAYEGNSEVFAALIEAGANPFYVSQPDLFTPLCAAAYGGSTEIVEALVGMGADVNHRTSNGSTCGGWAGAQSHRELAEYLFALESEPR